jgi:hypothetical protein
MLLVTTGGWESHYSPRGINGPIDDILFPIQHGMLFYPGFEVLPPLVIYRTSKTDDEKYAAYCQQLAQRLTRFGRQNRCLQASECRGLHHSRANPAPGYRTRRERVWCACEVTSIQV